MKRNKEYEVENSKSNKRMKYNEGQEEKPQMAGSLEKFIKDQKMLKLLKNKGVKCLFPVQYKTYEIINRGEDIMVRDKTGSGKTLAFALPVIQKMRKQRCFQKNHLPKFLIILPTRELAIQVKDEIQSLQFRDEPDFRVIAVYGKSDIQRQMDTIKRGIDIIVGTPGRLIDLLQREVMRMNQLQVLCLDEADQMLRQGFKEDIQKIYKYITNNAPKKTQNLLFSATIPEWLHEISRIYQDKDKKFINLISEEALITPETLIHMCLKINRQEQYQKPKIVSNLLKKYAIKSGNSIIFCERKADVQRLSSSLNDDYDLKSEPLHSDVPQIKREQAYRKFKAGTLKCIIATNVAARGLDFPQIDVVIQTQPPTMVEPYIHRSGRTARKGRQGICITLYTDTTERYLKNIEREAKIRMNRLQASQFLGKKSQRKKQQSDSNSNKYNDCYEVFVKYIPCNQDEMDIKQYFRKKKINVKSLKLMKNKQGQSKGTAFLKFTSKSDREQCLELDGQKYGENQLNISIPDQK